MANEGKSRPTDRSIYTSRLCIKGFRYLGTVERTDIDIVPNKFVKSSNYTSLVKHKDLLFNDELILRSWLAVRNRTANPSG